MDLLAVSPLLRESRTSSRLFPRAKNKRQQERHDDDPRVDPAACRNAAHDDPNHETEGDDENIHKGNLLEPDRVGNVQDQIQEGHGEHGNVEITGAEQSARCQEDPAAQGDSRSDPPGGQGARFFPGVPPVFFPVVVVVEDVHRTGEQAEIDKSQPGPRQQMEIMKLEGKKKGQENEQVLCPLPRAHEEEQIAHHR